MIKTKKNFKLYCRICKKSHIYTMKPCPSCGIHYTPQPKSDNVCKATFSEYECDGCQAYRDHLK